MIIADRLRRVKDQAGLSSTDIANWMGVTKTSIQQWCNGIIPHEYRRPQIEDDLDLLEKAIKQGHHFPIPLSVNQFNRKDYVIGVRNAVAKPISSARSSR